MDQFPYFYGINSTLGILAGQKVRWTIQQGLTLNCRCRNLLSREAGEREIGGRELF